MRSLSGIASLIDYLLRGFSKVPPSLFFEPTPRTQSDVDGLMTVGDKSTRDFFRHLLYWINL